MVGGVVSIGTAVIPWAPLEPWYSTVCRPVPETVTTEFGAKAEPSRLDVMSGAPLIVTVASPVYHPLTFVAGLTGVTTAEIPPVGSGSVTGSMLALLLITVTFPCASTAWMNHSAAEPEKGPPPLQRFEVAAWDRSTDRHAPVPSLYSASTRFTVPKPSLSSTLTAKPTVVGVAANASTGPKVGPRKSVSDSGA